MGLFRKKSNDDFYQEDYICGNCGKPFVKMGNLYVCKRCNETYYMDEDGDLILSEEGDDYDYDSAYGTSQWDDDND